MSDAWIYMDEYCAYSRTDNHVVANQCTWQSQEFTHVSGSLGVGVGYMCAGNDCRSQVRVEGTTAAGHRGTTTLGSGDAVFCSASPAALSSESPWRGILAFAGSALLVMVGIVRGWLDCLNPASPDACWLCRADDGD